MFWRHDQLSGAAREAALHPLDTVDTRGAAKILGLSESALHKLRVFRPDESPRFIRAGGRVHYRLADLTAWQDARLAGGPSSARR